MSESIGQSESLDRLIAEMRKRSENSGGYAHVHDYPANPFYAFPE